MSSQTQLNILADQAWSMIMAISPPLEELIQQTTQQEKREREEIRSRRAKTPGINASYHSLGGNAPAKVRRSAVLEPRAHQVEASGARYKARLDGLLSTVSRMQEAYDARARLDGGLPGTGPLPSRLPSANSLRQERLDEGLPSTSPLPSGPPSSNSPGQERLDGLHPASMT